MNRYKVTWFDMHSRPQTTEEIIEAESFTDAKAFSEYKLERDKVKGRRLYNLEPVEKNASLNVDGGKLVEAIKRVEKTLQR